MQTIAVPWRKVCGALPAVALIGGGVALTALAGPARDNEGGGGSPAIVVPDVPLAIPAAPAPTSADPFGVATPETPALVVPKDTVPSSSTPVTLDSTSIRVRALDAYREGAASDLPSANSFASTSTGANPVTKPTSATPPKPAPGRPGSIPANVPGQRPGATLGTPSPTSTAASPVPTSPVPASSVPAESVPAEPVPAPLIPCLPTTAPPTTDPPASASPPQ